MLFRSIRVVRLHLVESPALKAAQMALAQALLQMQGRAARGGNGAGGGTGALQIAAVNGGHILARQGAR